MFVGRENELAKLEGLYAKGSFQMVVVYGRRRVGKTALLSEFGRDKRTLYFTALDQSDADNLRDFSRAVYSFFGLPATTGAFASWSDALGFVADRAQAERFVLIFDEFPYAAERGRSLPSALQIAIDHRLKETGLFLVLCGSNQGFMENEVLGQKGPLYGRRTAQMKIVPLGYRDAALMLPGLSPREEFEHYACFGGVPYYLEQVDPGASLGDNIARLYLDPSGFLFDEPYGLLRQEFREPALYGSILRAVAGGANKPTLIADATGMRLTTLPKYLDALLAMGAIEKVFPFGANPSTSKKGIYRVKDACYDFWFRFVMPRVADIEQGFGRSIMRSIDGEPLDAYLGRRFESLCAEWLAERAREGLLPIDATLVGTWWGADPSTKRQTDIDLLAADSAGKKLVIAECKYRNSFNETEALRNLIKKKNLIKGYEVVQTMLFSKLACSGGTIEKVRDDVFGDVALVALEEIYA